jgi:uncharacterized protein (DUF488 family)
MNKCYTIGYGGRTAQDFFSALTECNIATIVDVRLHPNHAFMGTFVKAKTRERGIERLLAEEGIIYSGDSELFGNPFIDVADWREPYQRYVEQNGPEMISFLKQIEQPFALMCAERKVSDCHREYIADYLIGEGWEIEHIA